METNCQPGEGGPGCDEHADQPGVAKCVGCGRVMCALCRVFYGNRNYCRSCLEKAGVQGSTEQYPEGGVNYPPPPPWAGPMVYQPPGFLPPPQGQPGYQYPYYQPYPTRREHEIVFEGTPWGVGEALLIFAISFILASISTFFIYQVLKAAFSQTTAAFLLIFTSSVVLYAFLLAGTFYSVKVRHGSTLSALGLRLQGAGKAIAWGLGLGVPLFLGAIFVAYLSSEVFTNNNPDVVQQQVSKISGGNVSGWLIALLAITLVVLAPVCEEIFFRGYLYPALRNRMARNPAMIVNGLIFAAAHFELFGFLPRFLLGWGLCYIYERNRTLAGPMTGHGLYNGLILLLSGLFRV